MNEQINNLAAQFPPDYPVASLCDHGLGQRWMERLNDHGVIRVAKIPTLIFDIRGWGDAADSDLISAMESAIASHFRPPADKSTVICVPCSMAERVAIEALAATEGVTIHVWAWRAMVAAMEAAQ